jgi:low affinity Fe/Cu permease
MIQDPPARQLVSSVVHFTVKTRAIFRSPSTICSVNRAMTTTNTWFAKMAQKAARVTGSSPAFLTVCLLTLLWLVSGPFFHWSDTWQLVINTVSNIVAMLMLFLIQNTQNRESAALQLKADELLRAMRGAQNAFINLEELSEEDLERIKERYAKLAELARAKAGMTLPPEPMPQSPQ